MVISWGGFSNGLAFSVFPPWHGKKMYRNIHQPSLVRVAGLQMVVVVVSWIDVDSSLNHRTSDVLGCWEWSSNCINLHTIPSYPELLDLLVPVWSSNNVVLTGYGNSKAIVTGQSVGRSEGKTTNFPGIMWGSWIRMKGYGISCKTCYLLPAIYMNTNHSLYRETMNLKLEPSPQPSSSIISESAAYRQPVLTSYLRSRNARPFG
jgi:hypothetical protein